MKALIIEDELAASENLTYLLHAIEPNIEVVAVLDSVKSSVDFFSKPHDAELVFMDIHLADGISFEIFEQASINIPVVFTTAYNQYALKAFKFNSIDYLLKPIDKDELADALQQFNVQNKGRGFDDRQVKGLLELIHSKRKNYKTTFLVSHRDELIPLKIENIAYFKIDTGVVKAVTTDNKVFSINDKLEDIEEELDSQLFHRVNRQFIINKDSVVNLKTYFNGKLIVEVKPGSEQRIVVSKAKAAEVKDWLGS